MTSGVLLIFQLLSIYLFGFLLENGFNEDGSVLELVSLGGEVEFVIEGTINLFGLSVFFEQASQDSLTSDPKDLCGHSAFAGTSAFTSTSVVAFALGFKMKACTGARVDFLFALHYETVLD